MTQLARSCSTALDREEAAGELASRVAPKVGGRLQMRAAVGRSVA
jgi:hypothetical protein